MRRLSLLMICVASWMACEPATPELGVMYRGARISVIDMHLHTGDWDSLPPRIQEQLGARFPFPFSLTPESTGKSALSREGVLEQLDLAGIEVGVLLAVYAPRSVGIATNEVVQRQVEGAPDRFLGLASLRVDQWNQEQTRELMRLERALMDPHMVGIKLAHAHQHFRFDDPAYFPIYTLAAQMRAPIYLHTGPSTFDGTASEAPYTDPAYLETAIQQHPDTIFILGHLGYDFIHKKLGNLDTCIRLAKEYDNVYLEPSAMGSSGSDPTGENLPEAMRRMRAAGVTDKIIYGSDGPQAPGFLRDYLERTLGAMESTGYTVEEARAVLSGNFERVFDVDVVGGSR